MTLFTDNVEGHVDIKFSSKSYKVPAGNIVSLNLQLWTWGYEGTLVFSVNSQKTPDDVFETFQEMKPIKLTFSLQAGLDEEQDDTLIPLDIEAWVYEKGIEEEGSQESRYIDRVIIRYYTLHFKDPARLFWRQHHLEKLYIDSDFKTIINEQVVEQISVTCDGPFLEKKHKQILVSVGLRTKNQASFYDYIIWLVKENNGLFYYDYTKKNYVISEKAPKSEQNIDLSLQSLHNYKVIFPEISYSDYKIQNAYVKDSSAEKGENENKISPLTQDFIGIWDLPADFKDSATLFQSIHTQEQPSIQFNFRKIPLEICVPWNTVKCIEKQWSKGAYPTGKKYIVRSMSLEMNSKKEGMEDNMDKKKVFECRCYALAQSPEELTYQYPSYIKPEYPLQVEGEVFSDQGEEENLTYNMVEDGDTSVKYYEVEIPVFEKLKVRVPYLPVNMNGQFYFPPYKKQQVLLAIWHYTSDIISYLDWRKNAPLAMDTQGNQIVLGQSEKNRTTIKHSYADNKPQLEINRLLEKDTQTITLGEGIIILHTKEDK